MGDHRRACTSITPGFFPAEQNKKLLYNEDGTPSDRAKAIFGHTQ